MKVNNKKYAVFFRRNNKERFWELEAEKTIYGFTTLLDNILVSTKERELEIKLVLISQSKSEEKDGN